MMFVQCPTPAALSTSVTATGCGRGAVPAPAPPPSPPPGVGGTYTPLAPPFFAFFLALLKLLGLAPALELSLLLLLEL